MIRDLLQEERFNVTTTNFLPQTYAQIEASMPSLLIVDIAVGEKAGWDLLAELREVATTPHIPILLVSTSPALLERAKAERAVPSGSHYLTKPFDLDDLLAMVIDIVGEA